MVGKYCIFRYVNIHNLIYSLNRKEEIMITTFLIDSTTIVLGVACGVLLILAVVSSLVFRTFGINKGKTLKEEEYHALGKDAEKIIDDAKKQGEKIKKDMIYEAKQEINSLKQTHEREVKERKAELLESEKKLGQREDRLDSRSLSLDKREDALVLKENKIENQKIALVFQLIFSLITFLIIEQALA